MEEKCTKVRLSKGIRMLETDRGWLLRWGQRTIDVKSGCGNERGGYSKDAKLLNIERGVHISPESVLGRQSTSLCLVSMVYNVYSTFSCMMKAVLIGWCV